MTSSVQRYDKGDAARFSVLFQNLQASLADPTTIRFSLLAPDQTTTTYTFGVGTNIVKTTTGSYYLDFVLSASGRWGYKWEGTGNVTAVFEDSMFVEQSAFS